ncbi:MAG: helix-turn-helix domain-containing protein [Microscillaceae bacterium]|nr:helix-turn-helix domain-containing protein [Microscillaceae bacterium]
MSEDQELIILKNLHKIFLEEKPYLDNTLSLPKLAGRLKISTHHLSQIINDKLDQSFFELIAFWRVREAQEMLGKAENQHLKIEEIAEKVGYNSKSAFNTAFKKHTQMTPAAYRKQFEG